MCRIIRVSGIRPDEPVGTVGPRGPEEDGVRKILIASLALGALMTVAPASADHCQGNIVMWGQPYGLQANSLGCDLDGTEDTDLRTFLPGTTGASVGYAVSCTAGEKIDVAITGSLWPVSPTKTKLTCITLTTGGTRYEGGPFNWAGGRTAQGCMTATVAVVDEEFPSNTWKTAGATC